MDALNKALDSLPSDAEPEILAKVRGLMVGYHHRWKTQEWQTLAVEQEYHLPIINPETGRRSQTFTQAGKQDALAAWTDGRIYQVEHKTTSSDIADPNATYWRQLDIDAQVSAYVLANWQQGMKLDGTLYDVIRKPTIKPGKVKQGEKRMKCKDKTTGQMRFLTEQEKQEGNFGSIHEIYFQGTYYGFDVQEPLSKAIRAGEIETPELFEYRLAHDCLENPEKYYARKQVPRLDSELLEYASELWDVAKTIHEARKHDRHYRNSSACMSYGRPCEYLPLCSGHDTTESDQWRKRDIHAELESTSSTGVLTVSRTKCFQLCRRKHFYRYELGIERDKERDEALYFGTLFHTALQFWWEHFLKGGEHATNGNPANSVGEPRHATSQA